MKRRPLLVLCASILGLRVCSAVDGKADLKDEAAGVQINWTEVIKGSVDKVPPCSVEWKVDRFLPPNPEVAEKIAKKYDADIAKATNPRLKASLEQFRLGFIRMVGEGGKTPLQIKLQYLKPGFYHIEETFMNKNGNVIDEYFANGDGAIWNVNVSGRIVRILDENDQLLPDLARGIPAFYLSQKLETNTQLRISGETPDEYSFEGTMKGTPFCRFSLIKSTLHLKKFQSGYGASGPIGDLKNINSIVEVGDLKRDAPFPIPEKCIYRSYEENNRLRKEETWTLMSCKKLDEKAEPVATKWVVKPAFRISDERLKGDSEFPSEDFLKPR